MEEPPLQKRDKRIGSETKATAKAEAEAATSTLAGSPRKDPQLPVDGNDSFREDLSRLLYQPLPRWEEAIESSLSVIPWKIHLLQEATKSSSTASIQTKPSEALSAAANTRITTTTTGESKALSTTETTQSLEGPKESLLSFPSDSYLDLRRKQNLAFADQQASKAQQELTQGNPTAARAAWKQALDLVPGHVPSLVGYAEYCLSAGKLEQAEKLLSEATSIDPRHPQAERLTLELLEARHRSHRDRPYANHRPMLNLFANNNKSNRHPNLTARESKAYQDALLERQLLASPGEGQGGAAMEIIADSKIRGTNDEPSASASLSSSAEESKERRRRSRRKKDRRHKDRRKKRKRKDHRKHHKRRRSRRKYYSSSDDSSVSESENSVGESVASRSKDSHGSRNSNPPRSKSKRESSSLSKNREEESETHRGGTSDGDSSSSLERRRRKRKKRRYDQDGHKRKRKHSHRKHHKRTKTDSPS